MPTVSKTRFPLLSTVMSMESPSERLSVEVSLTAYVVTDANSPISGSLKQEKILGTHGGFVFHILVSEKS